MDELIIGFDDNLGLPQDFADKINLKTRSYHDLTRMLQDFESDSLSLAFIPAGTLPYLSVDFNIVAQASFGLEYANRLRSKLVTAKDLTLTDLVRSKLGRVNQYCTTSFWAPLIYFMGRSKQGTSIDFIDTNGFQDLLIKAADQKIDGAMVWDLILENNPDATNKVHELGTKDDLPTPIIITKSNFPDTLKNKIISFKSHDKNSFFNGFTAVDLDLINDFREQMILASKHFDLGL